MTWVLLLSLWPGETTRLAVVHPTDVKAIRRCALQKHIEEIRKKGCTIQRLNRDVLLTML